MTAKIHKTTFTEVAANSLAGPFLIELIFPVTFELFLVTRREYSDNYKLSPSKWWM